MTIPGISPFKLLKPYEEKDRPLFKGRNEETRRLTEALMQTKFILLYGASGTGKTSLIQCGLPGMFSPRDWMPIFVRRGTEGFPEAIRQALIEQYEDYYRTVYPDRFSNPPVDLSLHELIQALFNVAYVPVYLILDQFEEIFTLGDEDEQVKFFRELQELRLFGEDLFCKILIVVREEYIAHFYAFEKQLPFLFEHRFRIEKMRLEQLEEVVSGTLDAKYEGYPEFWVQAGAPLQILANLKDDRGEIELTTLQVYLDRLYQEDLERIKSDPGERVHVQFDLELIGSNKIDNVLADFLDKQQTLVNERLCKRHDREIKKSDKIPLHVLYSLVTDQGTKRSGTVEDIRAAINPKKQVSVSLPVIADCVAELAGPDCRLLTPLTSAKTGVKYYEIAHDRLAELVSKNFDIKEKQYREALNTIESRKKSFDEAAGQPKTKREEYLLRPGELELINNSLNTQRLEPAQQHFLDQSRLYNTRKQRRLRLLAVGATIAAVVFLGVAGFAFQQKNKAYEQQCLAESNENEATQQKNKAYEQQCLAESNENEATQQRELAERQTSIAEAALLNFKLEQVAKEKEQAAKDRLKFGNLESAAGAFLKAGYCKQARIAFEEAAQIAVKYQELEVKIVDLRTKVDQCDSN